MWDVADLSIILGAGIGFALAATINKALTQAQAGRAERVAASRPTPVERRDLAHDRRLGGLLIGLGVLIVVLGQLGISAYQQDAKSNSATATIAVGGAVLGGVVSCLVCIASSMLIRRGRRMRAREAERTLETDPRPPIVYLRPFNFDRSSRRSVARSEMFARTHEQRLARALRRVGPFVAIGDPAEKLPDLGADRLYRDEDHWQETVVDLTRRAGTIVVHVGDSPGLAWEVQHVVNLGQPERIILSLVTEDKQRYHDFRDTLGHLFPRRLPGAIGSSNFVYFDGDWTPRADRRRGSRCPVEPVGSPGRQRSLALHQLARAERARAFVAPLSCLLFLLGAALVVMSIVSSSGPQVSLDLPGALPTIPAPAVPGSGSLAFHDRAQTICRQAHVAGGNVPVPASSAGNPERTAYGRTILTTFESMLGDMRALAPPADRAAEMKQFVLALGRAIDTFGEEISAVERRDDEQALQLGTVLSTDWATAGALARQLGFSECSFLDGP